MGDGPYILHRGRYNNPGGIMGWSHIVSPIWLQHAILEIGVKEIPGVENHPRIIEYGSVTTLKPKTDEVPWCADYVSWCLEQAGIISSRSASARSYMSWGEAIPTAQLGCVVIRERPPDHNSGHVHFFLGGRGDHYFGLGGNQGNEVNIGIYPYKGVIGYRWPKPSVS